eukprot:SAG31_NODE_3409_length_4306_cov_1.917281_3_plen_68_part_00
MKFQRVWYVNCVLFFPNLHSGSIETLELERESLVRKNEFLTSSLHTIRKRDQARAAVLKIGRDHLTK